MITHAGGEFLDVTWAGDDFVARDKDGDERVRISWAGWPPQITRLQRLQVALDICAALIFPTVAAAMGRRRFDDPVALVEPVR